ncbi:MAG: deoxyribose-phosphate aldolase [Dorea sp.]|jgi:deoxyribose-phosphate aldolase|nr:deoxyribose-phosphate aldolase [Dorea sp.]
MISAAEAARLIDISAVRTHHTLADMEELVEYAKKYRFINVHVLPAWVSELARRLRDVEGVYVGSPVGFPSGAHCTSVKLLEAQQLLQDGVEEMDIVMNVGKFKNREYTYVQEDLRKIIGIKNEGVLTKVIIEINTLNDDEMLKACEIAIKSGADFVKTGTGWVPGNANIERIRKMKEYCGKDIKIKAAGGIRTQEEFLALYEMGVERMGINTRSALEIVRSFET